MTTELIKRLRHHADTFEKSGFAVDGLVKDYREAADTIQLLSEKLHVSQTEPCEDAISRTHFQITLMDLDIDHVQAKDGRELIQILDDEPPVQPEQKIDMVGHYKVITLCGSTRFKNIFLEVAKELTLQGYIVLMPMVFGHAGDTFTDDQKAMLDNMHKRKINMSDEIYVINKDGYIGSSTKSEIRYAQMQGKPVKYMEE